MNEMSESSLPIEEASGKELLNGSYRVSFTVDLTAEDSMQISDLIQVLSEGLEDVSILDKLSSLDVKKLVRTEKEKSPTTLAAGDRVQITRNLLVHARIQESDGEYFIGDAQEGFSDLGEQEIVIEAGNRALVNTIKDGTVELVDFENSVCAEIKDPHTDDVFSTSVLVTKLALSAEDMTPLSVEDPDFDEEASLAGEIKDPVYYYVIDQNERGLFRAHVETENGDIVYQLSNEEIDEDGTTFLGGVWLVTDGFMKNIEDVSGLELYLKDMKIIPPLSMLDYRG